MKKIISLALVLCMTVACFAIAPAGAAGIPQNLLTYTEDNTEGFVKLGAAYDSDKNFAWGEVDFPPNYPANGYNPFQVVSGSEIGEMGIGNVIKAPVADIYYMADNLPSFGAWGATLDIGTFAVEAGKTYTFFFRVKADKEITQETLGMFAGLAVYQNGTFHPNIATYGYRTEPLTILDKITTEWQTVSVTFTADATLTTPGTLLRISFTKVDKNAAEGNIYIDGIALAAGDAVDTDAYFTGIAKDPTSDDVDNDGIPNRFDPDIDGDNVKNVWDRDMDNDGIKNCDDNTPFGGK